MVFGSTSKLKCEYAVEIIAAFAHLIITSGDKVGYNALHQWVYRKLGFPDECEECGFKSESHRKIHWANISKKYERNLKDWLRLCAKCHYAYDRKS